MEKTSAILFLGGIAALAIGFYFAGDDIAGLQSWKPHNLGWILVLLGVVAVPLGLVLLIVSVLS